MSSVIEESVVRQLVEIYFFKEHWHKTRMSVEDAFKYHSERLKSGAIYIYEEGGEVLGYYERYFKDNICTLFNLYVKEGFRRGRVIKELYKHFFGTLPKNIDRINGERQKLGGKWISFKVNKEKNYA